MAGSRLPAGRLSGLAAIAIATVGCGSADPQPPQSLGAAAGARGLRALARPGGQSSYAQWPSASHDSAHSGSSPFRGPTEGRIAWRRKLEGPVTPGPAVDRDGTIYAASNGGVLHALDPSGRERWSFDGGSPYGSDLSTTPAITREGIVLWPGPGESLYALDGRGALLWRRRFGSFLLSPALGADGTVYVVEMGGRLHALSVSRRGARERWSLQLGGPSYGSPAVRGSTVYTTAADQLVAVDAGGPEPAVSWRFGVGADLIEVSPAVGPDGTVLLGTNDGNFYGLTPAGEERWRLPIGDLSFSSPVATPAGVAYMGDHGGGVSAVRIGSGELLERLQGRRASEAERSVGVWTAPLLDREGNVYFGTRPGHVYGFRADGRPLFDLRTGGTVDSYPALSADETLLIGSADGFLYAIR